MGAKQTRGPIQSAIARSIDLDVPTNRAILILSAATLLVSIAILISPERSIGDALLQSLALAGTVFLAWALGREVDPDHQSVAFLSSAGALAASAMLGAPSLLLVFWFLVGLRLIIRSPGRDPSLVDMVIFAGVSIGCGIFSHWVVCFLAVPVLLVVPTRRTRRTHRVLVAVALPAAGILLGIDKQWHATMPSRLDLSILVWTGIALVWLVAYRGVGKLQSVGDQDGEPLQSARLRRATAWALLSSVVLAVLTTNSLQVLAPMAASFAAVLPGRAAEWIYKAIRFRHV